MELVNALTRWFVTFLLSKIIMEDTRPQIPLTYSFKIMKAHDGERFVCTAWNSYHGVFLVTPEFPNASYDQNSTHRDMHELAKKHHCYLQFREG